MCAGCLGDIDKYFAEKRLNRLAVVRDDIQPGTLIIHANGTSQSTDHILDVAPNATLPVRGFEAVLPAATANRSLDAGIALKVVQTVLPVGVEGAVKLTSNVQISQVSAAGMKITETQLSQLLQSPEGEPLKKWIIDRARRKIGTYVVMETYRAKELTMIAENGRDITSDLAVGATKLLDKVGVKFKVTRSEKDQLILSGDKYYVFALAVAAFDVIDEGQRARLGELGVDLSQPVPRVPVLGDPSTPPEKQFRPVGLTPAFQF
jgi:hypothetical protein